MKSIKDIANKNLVIKIPLWALLLLALVLYAAWEYYWYTKIGLSFIKWHTHLAGYIYLWAAGLFVYLISGKKKPSAAMVNLFLLFSSVLLCLFFIEVYFIASGGNKTTMEEETGIYKSPYLPVDKTHYHIWVPGKDHWITSSEYSFWRPANSEGLSDYEWPQDKNDNKKRIMVLGDSFAEGAGAAFDSSYVAFLRRKLNNAGDSFYVMDAGVCGSDPFNNYLLLRDRLLKYKPDIIIQTLGSNDLINDIILRGGLERFRSDGTQKFNDAPWWEPLYAINYTSRLFFDAAGYNELLVKANLPPLTQKKLNDEVAGLFRQYESLCNANHIRLVVALFPVKKELKEQKYSYDFSAILTQLKAEGGITVVDLLPLYTDYMKRKHLNAEQLYWNRDMHHNAGGYSMMADCIYEKLGPVIADSAITK